MKTKYTSLIGDEELLGVLTLSLDTSKECHVMTKELVIPGVMSRKSLERYKYYHYDPLLGVVDRRGEKKNHAWIRVLRPLVELLSSLLLKRYGELRKLRFLADIACVLLRLVN